MDLQLGRSIITTFDLSLYTERRKLHTYLIWITFEVNSVRVELRQCNRDKCDLVVPSSTTLNALVQNNRTTSAVSLFSEGLCQLGFSEQLER